MGIGWALFEEMIIDAKSGVVRNPNLLDYKNADHAGSATTGKRVRRNQ